MDLHSRAPKKNTSHGEVLPHDTTHLTQRGSPCKDPAGDWTTWRPPDHRQETQTAVVWTCLLFIRSGQNYLAVKGERRQGRQRKRWEDNIREWTVLELAKSQRAVENREKWRKLVVKLSVVPQRPSRLRDWWWWLCTSLLFSAPLYSWEVWKVVKRHHFLFWKSGKKKKSSEPGPVPHTHPW